jgi:hypothetical protein
VFVGQSLSTLIHVRYVLPLSHSKHTLGINFLSSPISPPIPLHLIPHPHDRLPPTRRRNYTLDAGISRCNCDWCLPSTDGFYVQSISFTHSDALPISIRPVDAVLIALTLIVPLALPFPRS